MCDLFTELAVYGGPTLSGSKCKLKYWLMNAVNSSKWAEYVEILSNIVVITSLEIIYVLKEKLGKKFLIIILHSHIISTIHENVCFAIFASISPISDHLLGKYALPTAQRVPFEAEMMSFLILKSTLQFILK